jgi:hypothetical protein
VPGNSTGFRALSPSVSVDNGEIWYFTDLTVATGTLAAGDSTAFIIAFQDPITGFVHIPDPNARQPLLQGVNTSGIASARGVWANSGTILGVYLNASIAAAGLTYSMSASVVKMPL